MSDSVVNTGGEDVLTSIKRLVSEEVREESEFIFIPTAEDRKPGRLVLTEALRVNDQKAADEGDKGPAPLKLVAGFSEDKSSPETDSDGSDAKQAPIRLQPRDKVEPKASDTAPEQAVDLQDVPVAQPVQADNANKKRELAGSLSAKIEALEAAIARTEDQWEPDGESNDDYSGTKTETVGWPLSDQFEQTTREAANVEPAPEKKATFIRNPATTERPSDPGAEPISNVIGEDALREMVAQIVREELQGALGERITQNLRKMVRREISRAIAAKNLK